jgi:DNA-binding SARP family transcriptional activator
MKDALALPRYISHHTRRVAELTDAELWARYFSLGGMGSPADLEAYLGGGVAPSRRDRAVLAQALDERFSELGYADAPTEDAADVRLGLLGSFSLRVDGRAVHVPMNAQRLLCFLALHDGMLLRHHVAGSLWGDSTDSRAAGSLRTALWRLRSGVSLVDVHDSHLRLASDVVVDVRSGEAQARRLLDDTLDLDEADADAALLSVDLLSDWTEDWVLVRREFHTQLRVRALEALCRRLCGMRRFGEAVESGMLAVSAEPLRESSQRTLLLAHLADENVSEAISLYGAYRDLLHDELGLAPSADMRALVAHLGQ